MWNILYVRPVIGKYICPSSWSSYELTTAVAATVVTIKLYYSCCYCYYYNYYNHHQTTLLLLLLLMLLLIKKATRKFLVLKYLVSEVCSFQNSRWWTKCRNPVINIFSAQVLRLTPGHFLLQEKLFLRKASERLSKPNIFILNNHWDVVPLNREVLDQVNERMFSAKTLVLL